MKRDIEDGDLFGLLEAFYAKLEEDPLLAPYFIMVDMADHMPRIVAFWSTILFRTGRYRDNAFAPHQRMPGLTADHFSRWVATLESAVDERFRGIVAEQMKATAHRIAYSMQLRLDIAPFAPYRP
ncbi:MAG: group III truncated hemoglobin [Dehalococcoidia bacterium]